MPPVARNTSFTEDPANRRRNGGGPGTWRWVAHLIPMSAPQVVISASGPAVFHSDFSPVTAARPARSGEVLIVQATGLGPTLPGVDPGQPFPTDAILRVNSPPRRHGEWSGCGSGQRYRMARSGGYVSRGLSGSVGHGGRNGFRAVERGLDCWTFGVDRGSINNAVLPSIPERRSRSGSDPGSAY